MSDKKHIDRLFQENFKDFEVTPDDKVWEQIETNLKKNKKRRVIPIWWRYAGVAALLLLFLTIGGTLINENSDEDTPIQMVESDESPTNNTIVNDKLHESSVNNNNVVSNSESTDIASQKINTEETTDSSKEETSIAESSASKTLNESYNKEGNKIKKEQIIPSKQSNQTQVALNTKPSKIAKPETSDNTEPINNKTLIVNNSANSNNQNIISDNKSEMNNNQNKALAENKKDTEEDLSIEEAIEKNKDLVEKEIKNNRWAITPNAAPVYFNTLGQGSPIDPQFSGNSKSGEVNMSYGLIASYALNDRVSIRSGINKVNLGYNTNDAVIFNTVGLGVRSSLQNVRDGGESNLSSDNVAVASEANFNDVPIALNSTNTTLNQAFGYIEVPLEIQYAISNKKFGVNVIGGFSSLFLSDNSIYSEAANGNRVFLGEASNLNKVSYSANFGLGFNYNISKKLDLNLEPMFKYQFNTFSNSSGNFQPFFIGVYSGLAIKF